MEQKPEATAKVDLLDEEHDISETVMRGPVTRDEALQVFLELGEKRSIAKVRQYFLNQKRPVVVESSIKRWCATGQWRRKAREWDVEVAIKADTLIKEQHAAEIAKDVTTHARKMRSVSMKMLQKLDAKIGNLKIASGSEAKAVAEAAVALNKAAEVLDGGVSDRTEHRQVATAEERRSLAEQAVADAFRKFSSTGQDNGKRTESERPVDNAGDAGRGAASV